jgi:hypothetical protein
MMESYICMYPGDHMWQGCIYMCVGGIHTGWFESMHLLAWESSIKGKTLETSPTMWGMERDPDAQTPTLAFNHTPNWDGFFDIRTCTVAAYFGF